MTKQRFRETVDNRPMHFDPYKEAEDAALENRIDRIKADETWLCKQSARVQKMWSETIALNPRTSLYEFRQAAKSGALLRRWLKENRLSKDRVRICLFCGKPRHPNCDGECEPAEDLCDD